MTKIRNGPAVCQAIVGYDCNAIYLWATGLDQCTGPYCYRRKDENYKKHTKRKEKGDYIRYSQMAINWLDWLQETRGISIRHAENHTQGEMRIENLYVDGFCKETNTVFEFLGCYHHGHQCNPKHDLEKWVETQDRIKRLQEMGYKVESITQCEWNRDGIPTGEPVVCTQQDIQDTIMRDEVFGIVKVSLHVPDHLKSYFEDFPPLFKNHKIEFNDIGEHMKQFCRTIGRTKGVDRSLISSMKGEGMVMLTPLFKKYMEMGLVCTDIEYILEYNPKPVFKWFVDKVTNDRRRADLDPDLGIIGETSKTQGNACYGYCCIDKMKHNSVRFCAKEDLHRHTADPFFKSMEELDNGMYEIVKKKRKVIQDAPIQVAIAVYSMAKYSLISFWQFLNDHLNKELYSLMECDTDSLYIALGRSTIDECVLPEKKENWLKNKYRFFSTDSKEMMDFEGKQITEQQFQKRTPGLYKMEFRGDGMICLNSKVYHIWGQDKDGNVVFKTSSKGMQERNKLLRENFLDVLYGKTEHFVENSGFVQDGLTTKTYTQHKRGLNYFYCKRIVLQDGIHTTYLDI